MPRHFYETMQLLDEAILLGEAATLTNHISPRLYFNSDNMAAVGGVTEVHKVNSFVIEKLEAALQLNPSNFYTLYLLFSVVAMVINF